MNNSQYKYGYGNGIFLPSYLNNLIAWYRFNIGITVTGAGVSTWADQSGNGNDLPQTADTSRPGLESDGTILFDGVDNFLKTNSFTLSKPTTVYILFRQVSWTSGDRIFDGDTSGSGALQQFTTPAELRMFGNTVIGNISPILNKYEIVTCVFNSTSSVLQLNNDTPITGDSGIIDMDGFTLGRAGDGGQFSNIQVAEVPIFNAAHTPDETIKVINYLNKVRGGIV